MARACPNKCENGWVVGFNNRTRCDYCNSYQPYRIVIDKQDDYPTWVESKTCIREFKEVWADITVVERKEGPDPSFPFVMIGKARRVSDGTFHDIEITSDKPIVDFP